MAWPVTCGGWHLVRCRTGRQLLRASTPTTSDVFAHKKSRATSARDRLLLSGPNSGTGRREFKRDQATARRQSEESQLRIRQAIDNRSLEIHFQPILDLQTGQRLGTEALPRFTDGPERSPDLWFAEAASVGLGTELEIVAIELALAQMDRLPANVYMSINASVETILSDEFREAMSEAQAERIVLEVTEHTPITDYGSFTSSISGLRSKGLRIAVDDAGAGYAGLRTPPGPEARHHQVGRHADQGDRPGPGSTGARPALLRFGFELYDTIMVAEGIETNEELETLRSLGCQMGQGFVLGRPGRLKPMVPPPPLLTPDMLLTPTDQESAREAGPVLVFADEKTPRAESRQVLTNNLIPSAS